jgi:anti-anti-sigma regulatory factor
MLRIRVEDQPKTTTLYVEGKLAGDCVDELRRVWTSVRTDSPSKETVIDLCSVRVVDTAGKKLLCQMYTWGTRLAGSGLCISPLIDEITNNQPCADSE